MSSACKTQYRLQPMPETIVKIIGSKHFRYLVEKPKIKENEKLKTEPQTTFQKPRADSSRQISHEANAHCYSAPTGDQSLSYKHCLQRRKSTDRSLELKAKDSPGQAVEIVQKPTIMTREDYFLITMVRREPKSRPLTSSLLDKLQKELKNLDPLSSGFVHQSKLSHQFLRNEVPLQLQTVKLLCQRFSKKGSPEMVNYGELLRFLKEATKDYLQQKGTNVYRNPKLTPSPSHHQQSTSPQDYSLLSEVNKSLLEILKMALRTCQGRINTDSLNQSLRNEDRSLSGCLPVAKVRAVCGKHGLYLTLTLLEMLTDHPDLGYQCEIKWQNFVKWLKRASSDLLHDVPTGKSGKKCPADLAEVPERPQSKAEHVKTPEKNLRPEHPMTSARQEPVPSLKNRPVCQTVRKENEEPELWIDRFRKLEKALYLCDLSNTGVLEKERARRHIYNYNLIYDLSLSPQRIEQALRRFHSGGNIILGPVLQYLKEL